MHADGKERSQNDLLNNFNTPPPPKKKSIDEKQRKQTDEKKIAFYVVSTLRSTVSKFKGRKMSVCFNWTIIVCSDVTTPKLATQLQCCNTAINQTAN